MRRLLNPKEVSKIMAKKCDKSMEKMGKDMPKGGKQMPTPKKK